MSQVLAPSWWEGEGGTERTQASAPGGCKRHPGVQCAIFGCILHCNTSTAGAFCTMQLVHWCLLHRDTSLLVQFALTGALHRRQPFWESFPVSARQYLFLQYHRRTEGSKVLKSSQVIFVIDTSLLDSNTSFLVDQNCCYNALVQINLCSIAGQMIVSCPTRLSSISTSQEQKNI